MRVSRMKWPLLIVLIASAAPLVGARAWAHRNGGPNDPCERRIGKSLVHLTLYQPDFDPDAEYCNEVPREGKTVMVVDVEGEDLRQTPIRLDVVANDEGGRRTILTVPAKVYRRGVADAEVTLDAGNEYDVSVVLRDGTNLKPLALSFPVRIGAWYRPIIVPALIVMGLLGVMTIPIVRYYLGRRDGERDSDSDFAAA
jgi:hypothetical protein